MNALRPDELLETHQITRRLKATGVTEAQLETLSFRRREGFSFEQWSYRLGFEPPLGAVHLLKPYCTLKWLLFEAQPTSRDTEDGWRDLALALVSPVYDAGLAFKQQQRERAKKPRVKLTDENETMRDIVSRIVANPEYRDYEANELWSHLYSALDHSRLTPQDLQKRNNNRRRITYDYAGGRRSLSYSHFANLVSDLRQKNSR